MIVLSMSFIVIIPVALLPASKNSIIFSALQMSKKANAAVSIAKQRNSDKKRRFGLSEPSSFAYLGLILPS
jgi:hypothetical protein